MHLSFSVIVLVLYLFSQGRLVHSLSVRKCPRNLPSIECFPLQTLSPPFEDDAYRSICNFYRENYSRKRIVPSLPKFNCTTTDDVVCFMRCESSDRIVAAVRLTHDSTHPEYVFIRSLCIEVSLRRQGLGSQLLQRAMDNFGAWSYYCLADPLLTSFYVAAGFTKADSSNDVPTSISQRYESIARRVQRKNRELHFFVRRPQPPPCAVILLQHVNENNRATATGWLVDDEAYQKATGTNLTTLQSQLTVARWTWSGRADNEHIQKMLSDLPSTPILLWAKKADKSYRMVASGEHFTPIYIILDGTWQEAQSMFRKIPSLWQLPRLSLSSSTRSSYVLRHDYTGWKQRFSSQGGEDLLCTAEVIAALLDESLNRESGNLIRNRLRYFQDNFPQVSARSFDADADSGTEV